MLGEPVITPNLDSVSELKITTTAYDAEFGQASQAVISAQTKSGTNRSTAAASVPPRSARRRARSRSRSRSRSPAPAAHSSRPRCGTSSAAPSAARSRRTRRSIFGDYQGTRQKNGGSLLTRVPTAAERNGDLSDLNTPIFNPCTGGDCNIASGQPPAVHGRDHSRQPACRRRRRALLKFIPLPNVTGVTGATPNYAACRPGIVNSDAFDVRVDRYQTEKLHMFGRYSFLKYRPDRPRRVRIRSGRPELLHHGRIRRTLPPCATRASPTALDYAIRPHVAHRFPLRVLPLSRVRQPQRRRHVARQGRRHPRA